MPTRPKKAAEELQKILTYLTGKTYVLGKTAIYTNMLFNNQGQLYNVKMENIYKIRLLVFRNLLAL